MDGTRWLYDSDDDYKHAQKKLAAELAREQRKKELTQKARADRVKVLQARLAGGLKASVPFTKRLARRVLPLLAKRKKIVFAAAGVLIIAVVAINLIPQPGNKPGAPVLGSTSQQHTPSYDTIFPNNDINATSSKEFAYEPQKKVTSYTDEIGDAEVTVSMQPLPERFKKDPPGELAKFATDFNATEKLDMVDNMAYIGTSVKGPQTAVFIKNGLLVFISADKKFDKQFLSDYIISLQ